MVPDTSPERTAETGICMAVIHSVYSPKDSLLKKFPHRPITCPRRIPGVTLSAIFRKERSVSLQKTAAAITAARSPP